MSSPEPSEHATDSEGSGGARPASRDAENDSSLAVGRPRRHRRTVKARVASDDDDEDADASGGVPMANVLDQLFQSS